MRLDSIQKGSDGSILHLEGLRQNMEQKIWTYDFHKEQLQNHKTIFQT